MNVYLGQFCYEMPAGVKKEFLYLPYSVGSIWAYANTDADIRKNYTLKEFFIRKEDPNSIVESLDDPAIFALSCYVWNMNYSLLVAKKVKERFPNCQIIVGGPHIPSRDENFLKKHPFVDYAVLHEGEVSFKNILLKLAGHSIELTGVRTHSNEPYRVPERITDLDIIPSPYTTGLFDDLIEKYKGTDIILNGILESNRGCPFKCTFCDWGNGVLGKVKKFEQCRVHEDILWLAQNKIEFVALADANFGAFKERDVQIAKYLVECNQKYGFPKAFNVNWHKNQSEKIFDVAEVLMSAGMLRRFAASFQTRDVEALKAIKRTNIGMDLFERIKQSAKEKNIPVGTDLMLPLPEETAQSFRDTLDYFYNDDVVPTTSPTSILPGSEMADPEYKKQYGLVTEMNNIGRGEFVFEQEEALVSTNTLTKQEFNDTFLLVWTMENFHIVGFCDLLAKYYKRKHGIKFTEFYDKFWQYFRDPNLYTSKYFIPLLNHVDDKKTSFLIGGLDAVPMYDDIGFDSRERFYSEVKSFCKEMLPEDENLNQLINLQYNWQNFENTDSKTEIKLQSNLFDYITKEDQPNLNEHTYLITSTKYGTRFDTFGKFLLGHRYNNTWKKQIVAVN